LNKHEIYVLDMMNKDIENGKKIFVTRKLSLKIHNLKKFEFIKKERIKNMYEQSQ